MSAADIATNSALGVLQAHIGPCREWCDEKTNICGAPTEYVLWGKLLPAEALGPRCYDHAAEHVHHSGLMAGSGWALIHLAELAGKVEAFRAAGETP